MVRGDVSTVRPLSFEQYCSIYRIRTNMVTDPYKSIDVAWLVQEKGTLDWVYDYSQTDTGIGSIVSDSVILMWR